MAKDRPALAKSELEVVRIVWALDEATVRQVHEALPKRRKLDFWTVQTYLRRLKDKGYLKARLVGQGNVYSAAVQPKRVIHELMDEFLNRLFDGEVLQLVQQFVESKRLNEEEISVLQKQLDGLKGPQE